jgi:hypothetical protein
MVVSLLSIEYLSILRESSRVALNHSRKAQTGKTGNSAADCKQIERIDFPGLGKAVVHRLKDSRQMLHEKTIGNAQVYLGSFLIYEENTVFVESVL